MGILKRIFESDSTRKLRVERELKENKEKVKKIATESLDSKGRAELEVITPNHGRYIIEISRDDFDNHMKLEFKSTGNYNSNKVMTFEDSGYCPVGLGILYEENETFFMVDAYQKFMKLKKGEKFSLLLSTKEVIEFEFDKDGYRIDKDQDGVIYENKIKVDDDFLNKVCENELVKWRYISHSADKKTGQLEDGQKARFKEAVQIFKQVYSDFIHR